MRYQVGNLLYLLSILKDVAIGSYIGKLNEYSYTDFFLSFSKDKKRKFVISLQSSHPFVDLTSTILDTSSTLASPFFLGIRKELDHAYVEDVEVLNHDRILSFALLCTNEIYQTHKRYFVIELITGNANMFLLDEEKKILFCYRSNSLESSRPLFKGITYLPPKKNENFLEEELPLPYPLSSFFDAHQKEVEEKRKKDKYKSVLQVIKSNKKSLQKKFLNQEKDQENATQAEIYKTYGDLLFTYLYEIKSRDKEVLLEDVLIPLDPLKSPKENAVAYYKKYQKSRSALEHLKEQIEKTKSELAYFSLLEEQWKEAGEKELPEIEQELIENGYIQERKERRKKAKKAIEPYFITYEGVKIGYGKNNLQNDYLSFHLARKNDTFLHVKDHSGSHVVIFLEHPSKKILEFAASLALYLRGLEDGDVIFTTFSNVNKGNKKGLVQLKSYQTLHLSSIDKELFSTLLVH